ncbi:DUF397 domain-containing protein [Streptomonospora salina]|uniref:DUF397 domain-containing protein n=1 Tax=Streptomonospora salina TaxID=104205 RepID=A0A841E7B3_9ACTN|nr:DUF397 domain-containing protein [Streptomonospora salina]MBB5996450.1 hypothetical protein [Streptomonospora salina]
MIDRNIWHKSSYSGASGGDCVEVAEWYKSSYSGAHGGNCVEVSGWRKSSYSKASGECVEVADTPRQIHVRDSQHREQGRLTFSASSWQAFLATLKAEEL